MIHSKEPSSHTCIINTKDFITIYNLQVFAFGSNYASQSGVPGISEVREPTEIYAGIGEYCFTII